MNRLENKTIDLTEKPFNLIKLLMNITSMTDTDAVNRLLNQEIKCTIARGLSVLYCIGEKKSWRNTGNG